MKAKGGTWSFDDLNKFIANPKGFIPGTAMGFAGIPKDSERADVIAYLNSLSEHPAADPDGVEVRPSETDLECAARLKSLAVRLSGPRGEFIGAFGRIRQAAGASNMRKKQHIPSKPRLY